MGCSTSTPEQKFDDVFSRGGLECVVVTASEEAVEVDATEFPLERLGDDLVVLLMSPPVSSWTKPTVRNLTLP